MLLAAATALLAAACRGPQPAGGAVVEGFDHAAVGALPPGFCVAGAAAGRGSEWQVRSDAAAPSPGNALAVVATRGGETFNLCWNERLLFRDGRLTVAMRADRGDEDQGGGLAWRIRGDGDYYVCRYNPLESNFRLYVVQAGRRRQLATADVPGERRGFRRLAVEHRGAHIECRLDGERLLTADDATFPDAGGVGLWTKADACSTFDDLVVDRATGVGVASPR